MSKEKCEKCGKKFFKVGNWLLCTDCFYKTRPKQEPIEEINKTEFEYKNCEEGIKCFMNIPDEFIEKINEIIKVINNLCQKKSQ